VNAECRYFINESRCISIGSCISAGEREPKDENIARERETEGKGEEISVRIKRNSRSNRMAFIPCHLREPVLSSLVTIARPLLADVLLLCTFDEQVVKRFPIKRPSCCRRHVAGNPYKERMSGKGGQADDEEPAIIHLYTRDHPDRWPGSRADSSNMS